MKDSALIDMKKKILTIKVNDKIIEKVKEKDIKYTLRPYGENADLCFEDYEAMLEFYLSARHIMDDISNRRFSIALNH